MNRHRHPRARACAAAPPPADTERFLADLRERLAAMSDDDIDRIHDRLLGPHPRRRG